jgi:hypothetical protein
MLSVELRGRLGNQLFQYATLVSVARKNNQVFVFNPEWLGKDIFKNIDYGYDFNSFVEQNYIDEGIENAYNEIIFNAKEYTKIGGYFQSEKYFSDIKEYLKQYFNVDSIDTEYSYDEYCYIHFRGGDYLSHKYIPSINWYIEAMDRMKSIKHDIKFVVITDDIELASKYFNGFEILTNDMKTDYTYMRYSKYKILSASTFSWWGAYFSLDDGAIVIAPNRWLNHNYVKSSENIFYPLDIKTEKFIYI